MCRSTIATTDRGSLAAVSALLVLTVAALAPRAVAAEDAYEPDNTSATASFTDAYGTVQHHNNETAANGTDWVCFWGEGGVTYVIETFNLGAQADTVLFLYEDPTNWWTYLASDDDSGVGQGSRIVWQCPGPDIYYIKERPFSNAWTGVNATYDISVTQMEDWYEIDDTWQQAKAIPTNGIQQYRNNYSVAHKEDWVCFEAIGGREYTIADWGIGTNASLCLFLYADPTKWWAALASDADGGHASIVWTCPSSGLYYVKERPLNDTFTGPAAYYWLHVTPGATGEDQYEIDDAWQQAQAINTIGIAQSRNNYSSTHGSDWVSFWATGGYTYVIDTSNLGADASTVLFLYADPTKWWGYVASDTNGGTARIVWVCPRTMTYFLKERPLSGASTGTNATYDLRVSQAVWKPARGAACVKSVSALPTGVGAEIVFTLSAPASVQAEVVNIAGRPVKMITPSKQLEAGTQTLLWNGQSDAGVAVPNGRYLIRVTARTEDGASSEALGMVMVQR